MSGSGSLECSIFILLLNFCVSIHFTHTMHIFFITGLHHLQLLLEGNRVVHVARQHVLRDFSWALHIRPVYTGAAPCSPFWWSWWRCWWTHQRPIFNILGSSLQRVFPWRQYLCTFPTHDSEVYQTLGRILTYAAALTGTIHIRLSRSCIRENADRWPSPVPYILRKTSHQGSTTGFPCATKEARRPPDRDV